MNMNSLTNEERCQMAKGNGDGSFNTRIRSDRAERVQQATLEIMIYRKSKIKESELIGYLIDNYLEDAIKDLKNTET